jgi:enediyne biosynthesis protein E4
MRSRRTPLRRPARRLAVLTLGALGLLAAEAPAAAPAAPPAASAGPIFVDRAADWGLDFVHFNGMSGEYYYPEMVGAGAALFDYDGDGDLDAYLVQGSMLGAGKTLADATFKPRGPLPPAGRLFRNDGVRRPDGSLTPRFVDVTAASKLAATGYGMGVTAGDFDNDGRPDLYLADDGPNQLWHNQGDGTFRDVTAKAGVDDPRWSVAAVAFDFDRDGWLDLFVVDYVDFDLAHNPPCYAPSSRRDYCGPAAFQGVADRLFHNRGDGTFEDVSARAGIAAKPGPGLGAVAADFDGDGWPDLYVANDGAENFLWHNNHDGTFREDALFAGAALNRDGKAEAGMGVDAGDFDDDSDFDIVLAHLAGETDTLYVNAGGAVFSDRTVESGIGPPSLPFTSFGAGWLDYDGDGWLDLLTVSGAVRILEAQAAAGDPFPLKQSNQLFHNLGPDAAGRVRFADVSDQAGPAFALPEVSRGAAFGDVDDDGDTDVLVTNNSGPARLLVNQLGDRRPWLGLRLLDRNGRDALGAEVEVLRAGAPTLLRRVHTDGSFASASDPRVLVGLGDAAKLTAVRVRWPDGVRERFPPPPAGAYATLREGSGERQGAAP